MTRFAWLFTVILLCGHGSAQLTAVGPASTNIPGAEFPMGGAQALGNGLNHLDQFASIGAFSPAIHITDTRTDCHGSLGKPSKINKQLKLLWIRIGRDDVLYAPVLESREALERAGIKQVWIESSGAHVGTAWRQYLEEFAPRLLQ